MVKDYKPSRRGAARGTAITKPGTGRSYASSPCSARSTVSRSKTAGKLHKGLGHSIAKSARKNNDEATYQKCLAMIDEIQKEFQLALKEIDKERAYDSQSIQRLHAEKA
ncbi:hypothetical protein PENFLA_c078G09903 [Penicillium flavigenum]|uniref:Uncharacterized protein n=1 Tax=Penicillium flavigenum TaxID=254877 RepID=A0A1V6SAZ1_9EURO|nr:hypothetical protein PENFLA_c078G09903 [Penicillium flavigenum]